jgi:uncharacterized protein YydD (DUF2326 family)
MIERLDSSLGTFKALTFKPGLNVVLAEKSAGATDRQTRNGAGKTSLVELVHFLLGGSYPTDHLLRAPALADAWYGLRFDLAGSRVEVRRTPAAASEVAVHGDTATWPRSPRLSKRTGQLVISNTAWRAVLGEKMFGLRDEDGADEHEDEGTPRFGPTFRMLFPYFARRQNGGGFFHPQQHSTKQQPWDQQVSVTYLLGLDASVPQALQEVRQREKALGELRKAARGGALGPIIGKASDLRTKLAVQDAKVDKLRAQLATFQVVPQYREYEQEASRLSTEIAKLANENTIDLETIRHLEEAVQTETPPRFADVKKAYAEVGIALPGLVRKRFEDVERFHRSVVENRRSHLQSEIEAARERIRAREHAKESLGARRAELMMILQTGGALEHFSQLQSELSRQEAQAESLRTRFQAAETLERNSAELEVERARLHKRLQDDHHEQSAVIREAILAFEELSNALYEQAGSLTVSDTDNGPVFEVKIEASRSKGINNMQIFCFDMMLLELCLRRGRGPGFLIHDSHLFDGVDERQVARALEIGAARAEKLGFQYIVTLNEDAIPRGAMRPDFRFDSYVNPVRLTDATDVGGLFGLRFE